MARRRRSKYKYTRVERKYESSRVWRLKDQGNSIVLDDKYLLDKLGIDLRDGSASFREFLNLNKKSLDALGLTVSLTSKDGRGYLKVMSSNMIGAVPILSLKNNEVVCGIYIEPNLSWNGFGEICDLIGWPLVPDIVQETKKVPGGNKSIPAWLLAGPIIRSFHAALKRPGKSYVDRKEELSLVKGNVDYEGYIENDLSSGKWQKIPCEYDELSLDCKHHRHIVAIVNKLLNDLQKISHYNSSNKDLIRVGKIILKKLGSVNPEWPRLIDINRLSFRGIWSRYKEGFTYSKWLLTHKGLGGPDDGEGLPWTICSEELYELWVGYIAQKWAKMIGAPIKASSNRSSLIPINWDIQYEKTMSYLLPDYVCEKKDEVWIFDAKYKNLLEDLVEYRWYQLDNYMREAHRSDFHQILAYSSAFDKGTIISILAYPFDYTEQKEELIKYMRIGKFSHGNDRNVWIVLLPVPMGYKSLGGLNRVVQETISILNQIRNFIGVGQNSSATLGSPSKFCRRQNFF